MPVGGIAARKSRNCVVCVPASQACRIGAATAGLAVEGTASNFTPGASTTRSQYSTVIVVPLATVTFQVPRLPPGSTCVTVPLRSLTPWFLTRFDHP